MTWEPLPLDVAEWMGMDDDYLRLGQPVQGRDASQAVTPAHDEESAAA
jgi:hypothetical protein